MKFKNNAHNYNTRIYNIIMIVYVACGIWPENFDGYNIFLLKWNKFVYCVCVKLLLLYIVYLLVFVVDVKGNSYLPI